MNLEKLKKWVKENSFTIEDKYCVKWVVVDHDELISEISDIADTETTELYSVIGNDHSSPYGIVSFNTLRTKCCSMRVVGTDNFCPSCGRRIKKT